MQKYGEPPLSNSHLFENYKIYHSKENGWRLDTSMWKNQSREPEISTNDGLEK